MVRFKNRYIVFTIKPHNDSDDKQAAWKNTHVSNAIKLKVQQLYGDVGVAAIKDGFDAKYCNIQTKIAIIRLRHGPHKYALHAIPLINDVGGRLVKTKILYIGATLKHCFLFIRKHQEKKLEQLWSKLPTEAEKKRMETFLMTLTPAMKDFK
ncbi:PREDICTED: uncharacterized protein LOC105144519 [Acromyrmex echinatior]|uniref:Ribonuclease P/MRP protein subunit POP5 n=1 Tax=Acromyrmex echinatior TaxID=103372 RepID=F4WFB4_ACREC|nr:PREDICTED: uncharacterized protein LOC105144519 [Acromyrmex echinatior]EGI67165.1 Putative ribonuclease P/MRP protein subunit POP5 [Acromyrmex echinatior]